MCTEENRQFLEKIIQIQSNPRFDLERAKCIFCADGRVKCPWCKGQGHRVQLDNDAFNARVDEFIQALEDPDNKAIPKLPEVDQTCALCLGKKTISCKHCGGNGKSQPHGYQIN
ncbi:hypothetical protein Gasu2_33420 [Galdieria sulphuraria]|nr:hypothetical protein Gasu2_33420 [Galdieria sulphuraria]